MTCYKPLVGFLSSTVNPSGKRPIVFDRTKAILSASPIDIPCGRCIGCRLERSRQSAVRCVHEASQHEFNCFITLTYSPEHLPEDGSLNPRHFQLFMKRLRKRFSGLTIRFLACGEYGDDMSRPHYHALLFGVDFSDRELHSKRDDTRVYTSEILSSLWPFGFSLVGDVSFQSAAYVARYVVKKLNAGSTDASVAAFEERYTVVTPSTGELTFLHPEFSLRSTGGRTGLGGLGKSWREEFSTDLDKDFITLNNVKMRPPKYYDRLLEGEYPEVLKSRKKLRKQSMKLHAHDNTPERLHARHQVKLNRSKNLIRGLHL